MDIYKSIEFLQNAYIDEASRSIKERLETSIEQCSSFKGSIAFWTIDTNYLKGLKNVLKADDSFICVDIHQPTDIECLAEFVRGCATNIYLFLYRKEKESKIPLLHTKLLLLDFNDSYAEIWMGSQNMTSSAIAGFNLESTIVIPTSQNTALYVQIDKYLRSIKKYCEDVAEHYSETGKKFNFHLVNYYKALQQPNCEREYVVIDILCNDIREINNLSKKEGGGYILISAYQDVDYIRDKQEIIIRALDKDRQVVHYKARVNMKGGITPVDMTTTYTDGKGEKYNVNGFITQLRIGSDSSNSIPILSKKQIDISGYSTFIIVEFIEEFKGQLRRLKNKQLWKNTHKDMVSSLTYLHSIPENAIGDIQIPISLKDYERQSNSEYPFDKLLNSKELKRDIDALYRLLEEGIDEYDNPLGLGKLYFLENAKLKQKRTFARKLTCGSYLDDALIYNDEPKKLVSSHNEQVEMFPKA